MEVLKSKEWCQFIKSHRQVASEALLEATMDELPSSYDDFDADEVVIPAKKMKIVLSDEEDDNDDEDDDDDEQV